MKIAITGSTGFIGGHLVRYFAKKGCEVLAFGRREETTQFHIFKNITYYSWNITKGIPQSDKTPQGGSDFNDIDIFIHSAANLDYTRSREDLYRDNVESLQNIKNFSENIKQFIYISSSSVYQGKYGSIDVSDNIHLSDLKNSYSYSKYLAEDYIKRTFQNNHISIIRPRAVYGEGDRTLIPTILKNQIFGRLLLPGNGESQTSISEINSFVSFVAKLAFTQRDASQRIATYNFSSGVKTYSQIYSNIVSQHNLQGIIHVPIIIFKIFSIFSQNKYSYIVDTFSKDKILK